MRKRWVWALVPMVLQGLAFAACAEEETVEPETADPSPATDLPGRPRRRSCWP